MNDFFIFIGVVLITFVLVVFPISRDDDNNWDE